MINVDVDDEGMWDITPFTGFGYIDFDEMDGREDEGITSRISVLAPWRASVDANNLMNRQKRELKKLNMPSLGDSVSQLPN